MFLVLTVVLGLGYPLVTTLVAQLTMSHRANGSLVERDGVPVGSELIGQSFDGPRWFWGRPDAFDPTASGPSNLGPTNAALAEAVQERLSALSDPVAASPPIDAVTTSGSGLDPHISPAFARAQAPRVAEARGLDLAEVLALVDSSTEPPELGFLGAERVNVLLLNLALEDLASPS
jgi:K+-transporting ATPase ATPase C chain